MAAQSILEFFQDEEQHWVARLKCGHTVHMRHRPPQESRPWVTTPSGRSQHVGTEVDCKFCNMPQLPADVEKYKQTRVFDEETIPAGLTRDHATASGVWGRIVVESGRLLYEIPERGESWVLRPSVLGTIAPGQKHQVSPVGAVSFFVEFLREKR